MDNCFGDVTNFCLNCCHDFSEDTTRFRIMSLPKSGYPKTAEVEMPILDAIFDIFGLTLQDYLSIPFANNAKYKAVKIATQTLTICSKCASPLTKLYESFQNFKTVSDENSLLWSAINRIRNEVKVKSEIIEEDYSHLEIIPSFNNCLETTEAKIESIDIKMEMLSDYDCSDFEQSCEYGKHSDKAEMPPPNVNPIGGDSNFTNEYLPISFVDPSNYIDGLESKISYARKRPKKVDAGVKMTKIVGKSVQCCICSQTFVSLSPDAQDDLTVFPSCNFCSKPFFSSAALHNHILTHMGDKLGPCRKCGMKLTHFNEVMYHTCKVQKTYNCPSCIKSLTCDTCGIRFDNSIDLQKHEKIHYLCLVCGKRFKTSESLAEHGETFHPQSRRHFICKICGTHYQSKYSLWDHEKKHKEGKLFLCDFCGKCLPSELKLADHKLKHSKGKK